MKSDVEIAQAAEMMPIYRVAEQLGLTEDELELYGKYKAKVSLKAWDKIKSRPNGKLILVTAINPTPAPNTATRVPCVTTSRTTRAGSAPRAMRIPISCVRRETE